MNLQTTIDLRAEKDQQWIGFDLDGTIAKWKDSLAKDIGKKRHHTIGIGEAIDGKNTAFQKLKQFLKEGKTCKIVTARVGAGTPQEIEAERKMIQDWTQEHFGKKLDVVAHKDPFMLQLFDDKATHVEYNTGKVKK